MCSAECGPGSTTRTRTCTNPKPEYGGKNCTVQGLGKATEIKDCQVKPCPVDGKWGPWTEWGECTKECGGGTETRTRVCTEPKHGGKPCGGLSSDTQPCNTDPCPSEYHFL